MTKPIYFADALAWLRALNDPHATLLVPHLEMVAELRAALIARDAEVNRLRGLLTVAGHPACARRGTTW